MIAAAGSAPPPPWLIAVFPFYFVALSGGILYGLSGGWRKMAASYATIEVPAGERCSGASIAVNKVNFNRCMTIVIADKGLYIAPIQPIRIFSHPLLIPWSALKIVEERQFLWATQLVLSVQLPGNPDARIAMVDARVREAVKEKLRDPASSPFETLA